MNGEEESPRTKPDNDDDNDDDDDDDGWWSFTLRRHLASVKIEADDIIV